MLSILPREKFLTLSSYNIQFLFVRVVVRRYDQKSGYAIASHGSPIKGGIGRQPIEYARGKTEIILQRRVTMVVAADGHVMYCTHDDEQTSGTVRVRRTHTCTTRCRNLIAPRPDDLLYVEVFVVAVRPTFPLTLIPDPSKIAITARPTCTDNISHDHAPRKRDR